jgi:hypothetical protein
MLVLSFVPVHLSPIPSSKTHLLGSQVLSLFSVPQPESPVPFKVMGIGVVSKAFRKQKLSLSIERDFSLLLGHCQP